MTCRWSEQDWQNYLLEDVDQQTQKQMEQHLALCSVCMDRYTELLTVHLPALEQKYGAAPDLEQEIMATILPVQQRTSMLPSSLPLVSRKPLEEDTQTRAASNPQRGIDQTKQIVPRFALLHYGIAASLALLFLNTGVFDTIITYADHSQMVASQSSFWLEHALQSTEQWFAQLNKLFR